MLNLMVGDGSVGVCGCLFFGSRLNIVELFVGKSLLKFSSSSMLHLFSDKLNRLIVFTASAILTASRSSFQALTEQGWL